MGNYLNPTNIEFYNSVNHSKIYVDKTMLISETNDVLFGEQRNICISRPRRFGKSMAANMLAAYYSKGCDSRELFSKLKISHYPDFEKHLNKYNVIHLVIQDFFIRTSSVEEMISEIEKVLLFELKKEYKDVEYFNDADLHYSLQDIHAQTGTPFIFILDEWDCIFRVHRNDSKSQKTYLDFLCKLFKGKKYIALAYMTGILPIKKYGEHSALNMFDEFSMTNQGVFAEYTGFTESEVKELCERYEMSFEDVKKWYDGYNLRGVSIYNPRSVVSALNNKLLDNYWTATETYESIKIYINMNYDGLRDSIVSMIADERKAIDTSTFVNDMVNFELQDDILTLLIHLGYLAYDFDTKKIYIPNYEIREQFISTVKSLKWSDVMKSIQLSETLLNATLNADSEKVAEIIESVHRENTSIIKYNDENSLSCIISLAYYSAKKDYAMYRELAGGNGYADLVFVPRKECSTPAFIVELKWDKSAETAITQIKQKNYTESLKDYSGEILLVGINYDKEDKVHTCQIEKAVK